MSTLAEVRIWDVLVGAVQWDAGRQVGSFEYAPDFPARGWDLAPLTMPLADNRPRPRIYRFPALARQTFHGLPGLLADSLPDRFGNALINAWLARQGRPADALDPVERLCYTGARGMGALTYHPAVGPGPSAEGHLSVERLLELANAALAERAAWRTDDPGELQPLLQVGTSAGGARPKAVIVVDPRDGRFRSPFDPEAADGEHWIIKFDGVRDGRFHSGRAFGRIEYAYHRMALAAGIDMMPCRLLEEGGRAHFMTRRFDRDGVERQHMQSLCALAHADFNQPGVYSYEAWFAVLRRLRLGYPALREAYRRACFHVLARNQDDHTKNIAFLMDREGTWRLAPAYDLTFAFDPDNRWLRAHQMTLGGKSEGIDVRDLEELGASMNVPRWAETLDEVLEAIRQWPRFADEAGLDDGTTRTIAQHHTLPA